MLPRFSEFSPVLRLQDDMNRLFENLYEDTPATGPYGEMYPAINTWEDGENAYLEAELPGMKMEDLEVLVTGNEITLQGERKVEPPKEAAWQRQERAPGRFARTLELPWEIDAEKVDARLCDGVLTVKLPKAESCKPKKVKVLGA